MVSTLFNELVGFRLARMEIFNWGTFDGEIYIMETGGQTAVLTGANGSGKSTIVDALLTILVGEQKANYNLASGGSNARERSARTYILGQYSRTRGAQADESRAQTLRNVGETFTALLAVFVDRANERTVSLAQVLRITQANNVDKRYYTSPAELSIAEHFTESLIKGDDLPDGSKLFVNNFGNYMREARKLLGLNGHPKALDLFNQTVSVKDIASLNQFVRDHMLDRGNPEENVEVLRNQYRDLNEAHQSIQSAGRQLALLQPLRNSATDFREYEDRIKRNEAAADLIPFYVANRSRDLLSSEIEATKSQRDEEQTRLSAATEALTSLRDDLQSVVFEIQSDEKGQRKREIEQRLPDLRKRIADLQRSAKQYDQQVATLDLAPYTDEAAFFDNLRRLDRLQSEVQKALDENDHDRSEAESERREIQGRIERMQADLDYLRAHPSNIPTETARLRDEMSAALRIPADELPFLGELVKVRDEKSEWVGPLERLLRPFALELLVLAHEYRRVTQYVEDENLAGRLTYRAYDPLKPLHAPRPAVEAGGVGTPVYERLQVKSDTIYTDWLTGILRNRFDHTCCETLAAFQQAERALTLSGQIKAGNAQHEKDDTRDLHDLRSFVLGWDNGAKTKRLERDLDDAQHRLRQISDALGNLRQQRQRLQREQNAVQNLRGYSRFEQIDWRAVQNTLDRLENELDELNQQADQLRRLEQQRDQLQDQIEREEKRRSKADRAVANLEEKISQYENQMRAAGRVLERADAHIKRLWKKVGEVIENLDRDEWTVDSLPLREGGLKNSLQRSITTLRSKQNEHRANILDSMHNYKREFSAEAVSLTAEVQALAGYEQIYERLQTDDLPKHEERFKKLLDRTVERGVRSFSARLNKQLREIEQSINELNESLRQVDYGNGSYIQLVMDHNNDPEIAAFRQQLRECIPDIGKADAAELERAFGHIQALIEQFDEHPSWMRRVIDVRRWKAFAAEQIAPDDKTIDYYSDSSGKSGGQKAKLAYTILGAAIAYQYGLQERRPQDKTFRFVVIDEAFSKLDDDNARFAMELFKQLGLQLLVVTPMQQLHIIADYVYAYHLVVNNEERNHSRVFNISKKQYREHEPAFRTGQVTVGS